MNLKTIHDPDIYLTETSKTPVKKKKSNFFKELTSLEVAYHHNS